MTTAISLENISKDFPNGQSMARVLANITLGIEEGEFIAVTGTSGSGKTTLLNVLGLLVKPTSGRYRLFGIDTGSLSERQAAACRNETLGFVVQDFSLIDEYSVAENVSLPIDYLRDRAKRKESRRRVAPLLERLHLEGKASELAVHLSGGEKQRVAIARALVNNPKILLADEPTGSLDSRNSEEILGILSELNGTGITVVLVTHDAKLASRCKRQVHISDGIVLAGQ